MSHGIPNDEILDNDPLRTRKSSVEIFWEEDTKAPASEEKPKEKKEPSENDVFFERTQCLLSLLREREFPGLPPMDPFMGVVGLPGEGGLPGVGEEKPGQPMF